MTNVQTAFFLRLKRPAEVYADAVVTQQHMTQVYREDVTPVTLGVTFAEHQKHENWLKFALQKMTCRGLKNSETVESENI